MTSTISHEKLTSTELSQAALLVSLACILQVLESFIPHPIPGLRLGLSNVASLIALITLGFGPALEISIVRTILSSIIMGSFMSPGFILSFCAAIFSILVMGLFYRLSCLHPRYHLSIIGISILGALTHNIVQLYLAYFLLIRHSGIFVLLPWLALGAIVTGWFTATIAGIVCVKVRELKNRTSGEPLPLSGGKHPLPLKEHYVPGNSLLHRIPATAKIGALFACALFVLAVNTYAGYAGLSLVVLAVMASFPASFPVILSRLKGYAVLVGAAFFLPVFFTSGSHVLVQLFFLKITAEGINTGVLFALRNLLLIVASYLVIMTTPAEALMQGLARCLSFVRVAGISQKRMSMMLSLSWMSLGSLWETLRQIVADARLNEARSFRRLIPLLGTAIAALYVRAERETSPQLPT